MAKTVWLRPSAPYCSAGGTAGPKPNLTKATARPRLALPWAAPVAFLQKELRASGHDRVRRVAVFAARPPGAVVALRTGLFELDTAIGETLLAPPPFDPGLFRFNEGICERSENRAVTG